MRDGRVLDRTNCSFRAASVEFIVGAMLTENLNGGPNESLAVNCTADLTRIIVQSTDTFPTKRTSPSACSCFLNFKDKDPSRRLANNLHNRHVDSTAHIVTLHTVAP